MRLKHLNSSHCCYNFRTIWDNTRRSLDNYNASECNSSRQLADELNYKQADRKAHPTSSGSTNTNMSSWKNSRLGIA